MPRLLDLAIENGYYVSPIAGVRTPIAPKWLSALPTKPKTTKPTKPFVPPKPLSVWGDYWKFVLEHYFFQYQIHQLNCVEFRGHQRDTNIVAVCKGYNL